MNKILALVGMPGAGKTTAAMMLEKSGFKKIRFGDVTMDQMQMRGMDVNEENESVIRETLRLELGMDAYAKLNESRILELSKKGRIVVDGLYSWEEYIYLKPKFPQLLLVAIYASPKTRHKRLAERKERPLNAEESLRRDYAELENLNKAEPIAMADFLVLNEGRMVELEIEMKKLEMMIG